MTVEPLSVVLSVVEFATKRFSLIASVESGAALRTLVKAPLFVVSFVDEMLEHVGVAKAW